MWQEQQTQRARNANSTKLRNLAQGRECIHTPPILGGETLCRILVLIHQTDGTFSLQVPPGWVAAAAENTFLALGANNECGLFREYKSRSELSVTSKEVSATPSSQVTSVCSNTERTARLNDRGCDLRTKPPWETGLRPLPVPGGVGNGAGHRLTAQISRSSGITKFI